MTGVPEKQASNQPVRGGVEERCPTCGCPVRVVTGGEGTSHYERLAGAGMEAAVEAAAQAMQAVAHMADSEAVESWEDCDSARREANRAYARLALEAALPHLWSEGLPEWQRHGKLVGSEPRWEIYVYKDDPTKTWWPWEVGTAHREVELIEVVRLEGLPDKRCWTIWVCPVHGHTNNYSLTGERRCFHRKGDPGPNAPMVVEDATSRCDERMEKVVVVPVGQGLPDGMTLRELEALHVGAILIPRCADDCARMLEKGAACSCGAAEEYAARSGAFQTAHDKLEAHLARLRVADG